MPQTPPEPSAGRTPADAVATAVGLSTDPPSVAGRRTQTTAVHRHVRRRQMAVAPWLHQEIARRMDERLGLIRMQPAAILDWWSDVGGGADGLRRRYPSAALHCVEPLGLMNGEERGASAPSSWWRRWVTTTRSAPVLPDLALHWSWPPADLEALASPMPDWPAVQLLWSNMMLHWADHPAAVLAQWFDRLDEGGMLMFSCLGPDTARELASAFKSRGWGPAGAGFMDMHDVGDAVVKAGFQDPVMDMERLTLTWADPLAALNELRGWGGNLAPARFAGLRTARWRAHMLEAWQAESPSPPGVSLTVEVIYGHALRGPARVAVAPSSSIPLDTMRQMVRRRDV